MRHLGADHAYVPLLMTAPGIAWVLGYTIAAELGDIARFPSPKKLCGYTGLCPRVYQSGRRDQRGPLAKNGPKYLRWALIEAATHAARHRCDHDHDQATRRRLGRQRGPAVARVQLARNSPRRSGTCSPPRPRSARPGPRQRLWPHDGPQLRWASRTLRSDLILPLRRRYRDEHPTTTGHQVSPDDQPLTSRPSS